MADITLTTASTWGLLHKKALSMARKTKSQANSFSKWLAGDPKDSIEFVNTGIGGTDDNPEFLGCNQEYEAVVIFKAGNFVKRLLSGGAAEKYAKEFIKTYMAYFCGDEEAATKAKPSKKMGEGWLEIVVTYTIEDKKGQPNVQAKEDAIKKSVKGDEAEKIEKPDEQPPTEESAPAIHEEDEVEVVESRKTPGKVISEAWGNESPFESVWAENRQRKLERNMALVTEMVSNSENAQKSLDDLITEKIGNRLCKIEK